jgi:uncharacterized beta barrel domain-containing protein DUF5777
MKRILLAGCLTLLASAIKAQDDDLLKLVKDSATQKNYARNAFKSSRVINGHSMEMLGKGVLDVRILHRFGMVGDGAKELFGLDHASMRLGFDYGLGTNLTVGVGRSTLNKEFDGFIKYRPLRQVVDGFPFSVVLVSGVTVFTTDWAEPDRDNHFSSRVGYYHEVIIGRKFSNLFSFQVSPLLVHRNLVTGADQDNNTIAIGLGARLKFSKRVAFVVDYHPIVSGREPGTKDPLSAGFDIETGGHVFQLHFSNSAGMNEKEFITGTRDDFFKGDVRFGFNLSRVFQVAGRKGKK